MVQTAKDNLTTQLWLRENVSGEVESLSVSTETSVGHSWGLWQFSCICAVIQLTQEMLKNPQEYNSLSLLLTSLPRRAVAAMP